jgi:hypothetical protein
LYGFIIEELKRLKINWKGISFEGAYLREVTKAIDYEK